MEVRALRTESIAHRLLPRSLAVLIAAAMLTAGCGDIDAGEDKENAPEAQAEAAAQESRNEAPGLLDRVGRAFDLEPETVPVTVEVTA